jgi:hypothetical protein
MLGDDNQTQKAGDYSVNVQAKNIIVAGVSYSEAKDIADRLFRENFTKVVAEARQIVEERVQAFIKEYLSRLNDVQPHAFDNLRRPDVQSALYNAQKEFAKFGDGKLGDVLIDLLVRRTTATERTIDQIFLDEALSIVPRLTNEHLDYLTLNLLLPPKVVERYFSTCEELSNYFNESLFPFIQSLSKVKGEKNENSDRFVYYLNSLGCSATETKPGPTDLRYKLLTLFSQLSVPLDMEGLSKFNLELALVNTFTEQHWLDPSKRQWRGVVETTTPVVAFNDPKLSGQLATFIVQHRVIHPPNRNQFFQYEGVIPNIELISRLENIPCNPKLTPVGKIIAKAHYRAKMGTDFSEQP